MCTVTWLREAGGYQLFCNRDELRSRGIATPPALTWAGDVRYLAPRDADHGGTWVAVNQFGLTVCLLNATKRGESGSASRSRGLLLPDLMPCRSTLEVAAALQPIRLEAYAPFTLVTLDPTGACLAGAWDGATVSVSPSSTSVGLLSSSSLDAEGAREVRASLLARLSGEAGVVSGATLQAFHESHGECASAHTPCMHRADAVTVSFTRIAVTPGRIRHSLR